MKRYYGPFILGIIIGIVIGLLAGKQVFSGHNPQNNSVPAQSQQAPIANKQIQNSPDNPGIPHKVYVVLNYVLTHHQAMDGYVGGRVFQNREQMLPETDTAGNPIEYQEWDVNPKIEGENRGTERLITGSDGRVWYTNNHYRSFVQVK